MLLRAIVSRLKELGEKSSLHGLQKIVSSQQVVFKIFWTVLVIGASMLLGLQLDALYQEYTRYPTKTSITIEYGTLEFPSVTICNLNPIKRSKLENFPNASAIIRGEQQSDDAVTRNPVDPNSAGTSESPQKRPSDRTVTRNPADQTNAGTSEAPPKRPKRHTNQSIPDNNTQGPTQESPSEDVNQKKQPTTAASKQKSESVREGDTTHDWNAIKQQFLFALRDSNQSLRLLHGHTKNDLILMAMFRESGLPLTYMEPVLSAEHGICYTVNVDREIDAVGPKAGLKLVLLIDKEEYIQEANDGYGRVIIHERGTFPMPKEEGIILNPGYLTNIGMRRKTIERYGPPYSQCIDGEEFKEKYGFEYSNLVCLAVCRSEKFYELCGCVPHLSPEVIGVNTDRKVCPLQDSCIRQKAKEAESACNCLVKCKGHVYESRITSMRWPSPEYLQNTIYGEACTKNITSFNKTCEELQSKTLNFTDENYRIYLENFASLHIFYDGLVHEIIREEPLYSTITFLSDIGGSMSLFLGASLITYLELIHLLVELLICLCKRFYRKGAKVVPEKSTNILEKETY